MRQIVERAHRHLLRRIAGINGCSCKRVPLSSVPPMQYDWRRSAAFAEEGRHAAAQ